MIDNVIIHMSCHSMTSSPEFLLNKESYNAGLGWCFILNVCECAAIARASIVLSPLRADASLVFPPRSQPFSERSNQWPMFT